MTHRHRPWMKFYPSDHRADPALRLCSAAARGLWMEMLCLMHEADPYGSLLVGGRQISNEQLAIQAGIHPVADLLDELESAGVFSRDPNGTIFSRRMRRDEQRFEKDRANGKKGGNPVIMGRGVNPPVNGGDKAQIPESRYQKDAFQEGIITDSISSNRAHLRSVA
jgi:hypothetical protein